MKLHPLILAALVAFAGCSETVDPGNGGSTPIGFHIVYPQPAADGAYYAASGVRLFTTEQFRDSIIYVLGRSFYGQFTVRGAAVPSSVTLNTVLFKKHAGTDTLRLGSSSSANLFGPQTWELTDSAGVVDKFVSGPLQEVDSVKPLSSQLAIRGDTTLVLTWQAASSHGIILTWKSSSGDEYVQSIQDNGRFTIPSSVLARFNGDSELNFTRFRTDAHTYKGRRLYVTRIAQRDYRVSVFF